MLSLLFLSHFQPKHKTMFPPQSQPDNFESLSIPGSLLTSTSSRNITSELLLFIYFVICFFLSLAVKPVFRRRLVPLEINIGNTAKFECETEDAPNVSFKWLRDGNPIKEGDKYRIISRFGTSSLELLSPNKADNAEYTCKASNQHGSDECSASLSVTGKTAACFLLRCWLSCYWFFYYLYFFCA